MIFRIPIMACCFSSRDQGDKSASILDVEQIIKDHVWTKFKQSRPSWQQISLRRKDFVVDVPMNYFHFDKVGEQVLARQRSDQHLSASVPHHNPPTLASHMTRMPRDVTHDHMTSCTNVTAVSTVFTNGTDLAQTYKFRFERTRKASLNVTFQRGFTIGGKVNFSLGLPKLPGEAKLGSEVDMRLNVTSSTGELIEETLTWEATSEIQVAKTSNCTAKVLLSEVPVSYTFWMETKMSMPSGSAPVTIRRKNDDGFSCTHTIYNLKLVFEKFCKEGSGVKVLKDGIQFKTTGVVDGVRLSDQKIVLDSQQITKSSAYAGGGGGFGGKGGSISGGSGSFAQAHNSYGDVNPADLMTMASPTPDGGYSDGSLVQHHLPSQRGGGGGGACGMVGRMQPLGPSHHHSLPPSVPIIEEMPEDDGGVGEAPDGAGGGGTGTDGGGGQPYPHQHPHHLARPGYSGGVPGGGAGGDSGCGPTSFPPPPPPHPAQSPPRANFSGPTIGPLPRITTTPSSQASSPLSEAGSQDVSDSSSRKSETITTV